MSFYRCEIKVLTRAKGQSAARVCNYDEKSRFAVDRGHVNMPGWVRNSTDFWRACDNYERANASLARRAILSLPYELPRERWTTVIREWLERTCPRLPASWVIHQDPDGHNPHAHLLISERINDGIERDPLTFFSRYNAKAPARGGARKARISARRRDWLADARAAWADCLNKYLPPEARVDHRSLKDRGIDRRPQPKIGPAVLAMERRGLRTRKMTALLEEINHELTAEEKRIRRDSRQETLRGDSVSERPFVLTGSAPRRPREATAGGGGGSKNLGNSRARNPAKGTFDRIPTEETHPEKEMDSLELRRNRMR